MALRVGLLAALAVASGHALRMPQRVPQRHALRPMRCAAPLLVASPLEEAIQQTTASNEVVIYSKSWCPYCTACKELFDEI